MTITFAGHSAIVSNNRIKELVKEQIRSHITATEPVTCYLGGYGDFDKICACACMELKKDFTGIEVVYVAPYFGLSEQSKIKDMQRQGFCDTSIYPPIENTPPKIAITKRNEWMITRSDLIIAYINHHYGGAYKSVQFARRKKKKVINVFDIV